VKILARALKNRVAGVIQALTLLFDVDVIIDGDRVENIWETPFLVFTIGVAAAVKGFQEIA